MWEVWERCAFWGSFGVILRDASDGYGFVFLPALLIIQILTHFLSHILTGGNISHRHDHKNPSMFCVCSWKDMHNKTWWKRPRKAKWLFLLSSSYFGAKVPQTHSRLNMWPLFKLWVYLMLEFKRFDYLLIAFFVKFSQYIQHKYFSPNCNYCATQSM